MRIISWNVNGLRAVEKKGFLEWIHREEADIICIQETKAHPEQLSEALLHPVDSKGREYHSYWASAKKRGYSGVGIYTLRKPREIRTLGIPEFDDEGRILIADYEGFILLSAYFPNSQEGGARLDYKLAFCDAVLSTCNRLVQEGHHVLLCGDYNIAHEPIDLARPEENEQNPGYLPEERAWMTRFLGAGYVDTFRVRHPGEGGHYTWWSYRTRARERNIGWRIDYHCVNTAFAPQVRDSRIRSEIEGSDHCPIEIELEEGKL
ncbi:MAG: exodeoxyribonuclease III [Breznakiellaceae bacterium]